MSKRPKRRKSDLMWRAFMMHLDGDKRDPFVIIARGRPGSVYHRTPFCPAVLRSDRKRGDLMHLGRVGSPPTPFSTVPNDGIITRQEINRMEVVLHFKYKRKTRYLRRKLWACVQCAAERPDNREPWRKWEVYALDGEKNATTTNRWDE